MRNDYQQQNIVCEDEKEKNGGGGGGGTGAKTCGSGHNILNIFAY
jgi:hypothetical protein